MRVSYIIPVLNSHEVVRRQALHLARLLSDQWELLIIDDGSDPALRLPAGPPWIRLIPTHDTRPWTQPRARNVGAAAATGKYLFIADVDHILTPGAMLACERFDGNRLNFRRRYGSLSEAGQIVDVGKPIKPSPQACLCRRDLYVQIGGYDEAYCGRYGASPGDDHDFNARWSAAFGEPTQTPAELLVFPDCVDPAKFHGLSRGSKRDGQRDAWLAREAAR